MANKFFKSVFGVIRLACLLAVLFTPVHAQAADNGDRSLIPPTGQEVPLLPFLDYFIDESLALDIDEVSAPGRSVQFRPLSLEKLPNVEGITWLRFTISPLPPDSRPETFLLDMGESVPGEPILFNPERNELSGATEWRENPPARGNIVLLPEAGNEPITCYIKIEGLPGPWFYPIIRTPLKAASNLGSLSRTGAILALCVVMALCLLRGLSENGQWRIWTGLYVGAVLVQAILGMPVISEKISLVTLAAILSPGIALMLFSHVGRHLLRAREYSRNIDRQLLLLSLPGAALAIVPLLPGWDWLDRWLELWPLGLLVFVPTALGAWLMGLGGARRFLLGSLIPPLFVGLSLLGLDFGLPPYLLASGPLWGIAISSLLIATTRSPKSLEAAGNEEAVPVPAPAVQEKDPDPDNADNVIVLDHPLDDPNLRLIIPDQNAADESGELFLHPIRHSGDEPKTAAAARMDNSQEEALREPLDNILREGALLGQCSLPPVAREHAEQMINASKQLAAAMSGTPPEEQNEEYKAWREENFNLQQLIRYVHDSMSAYADHSGTSLSWHIPPYLDQDYFGNAEEIKEVLSLLLESSIRASAHGASRLTAKRVPEIGISEIRDESNILFTITDNGHGFPPLERSALALARAWELTGKYNGYFGMEASENGATVSFSLRLARGVSELDPADQRPHVIVACEDERKQKELINILRDLPCRFTGARNAHEVLVSQSIDPAALLITHGRMAMPAAGDMVREFIRNAQQAGFARCFIIAVTSDDSGWNLLKASGFTHAMTEPVEPEALKNTVRELTHVADFRKEDAVSTAKSDNNDHAARTRPDTPQEEKEATEDVDLFAEDELPEEPLFQAPPSYNYKAKKTSLNRAFSSKAQDAPTMLVEQKLNFPANFESPEWLENMPDDEIVPQQNPAPQRSSEDSLAKEEIQPINDKNQTGLTKTTPPPPATATHEERLNKPEQPAMQNLSHAESKPASNPLTDFIVGVERRNHDENEIKNFTPSPNGEKDSKANSANAAQAGQPSKNVEPVKTENHENRPKKLIPDDPVLNSLVISLDAALEAAQEAFAKQNCEGVAYATAKIATEADKFGLRLLTRMAQCVERAANAKDMNSISDLLPELAIAVERNRIALTQKTAF